MATSLLSRTWVFILVLAFLFLNSKAQNITGYSFSTPVANWSDITLSGATFPTRTGTFDEGYYNGTGTGISIGFDFWYMGRKYNSFSVSTNGWMTLGQAITNATPTNDLTSGIRPIIAPLWDDLRIQPGLGILLSGEVSYQVQGNTDGNRVLVVQWRDMEWPKLSTSRISFQVKLNEATGSITFSYIRVNGSAPGAGASASIGLSGPVSGQLSLNTIIPAALGTTNPNLATFPVNNTNYRFQSIVAAPTNLTFTNIGASTMTLNWTDNSGAEEIGFVIYRSTDNVNFSHLATTSANTTSYTFNGLSANVTYYYKVYALRESLSTSVSGSIATCQGFSLANIPTGSIAANYRFNNNANDYYGLNNGVLQGGPVPTTNRFAVAASAYQFNGTTQYVSTTNSLVNPSVFTVSIWFKTTVGGGKLIGFGSNQTGFSTSADRHIYMANDGKIIFGAKPGGIYRTVASTASYNDGNWHMATATMSTAGITLYIDGVQLGNNALGTSGENYTGYWRIGYDNMDGWLNTPTNRFFTGDLDDAYIYSRALSATEVTTLYNAGNGVSNTSPVCAATTLTLTANAVNGATYSWTGPNGFTSASRTPSLSYSDAAKGTYTVVVTAGGCSDVVSTVVTSTGQGRWTGNVSVNWTEPNNWCNGLVPTNLVNVSIPTANVSNNPTLNANGSSNNISVQSGRFLTIANGGNLQVAGAITNAGIITASDGKVTFNGTAAQIIPANVFSTNTIKDLELNNAAGVTLNGALRLTGILTPSTGAFNSNGHLTLASNATSTAAVAQILPAASVIGLVKVERFVKGGSMNPFRTYRMLSSPVYDNTTSFINSNVEGNRSTKFSQLIDDIIISGSQGAAGGFDVTNAKNASAWTYNLGYVPIPNITTAVNAGRGMYVYFRGNRDNFSQKTNAPYTDPENTVIDFDGVLNQQDITATLNFSASLSFNLVGNPYAATIDWSSANWGADKVNVNNAIWIFNPVSRAYATYINGVGTLGGDRYIASGQAFFVQATSAGASIKFKESVKAATQLPPTLLMSIDKKSHLAIPVQDQAVRNLIRINMKPLASYGEDETVIVFDDNSNANFTSEDALHFEGEAVHISSLAGAAKLAINFLPSVLSTMEIGLNVSAASTGNYVMKFNLNEYFKGRNLKLKDNFLQTSIDISSNEVYNFSIDKTNAQTFGSNRFSLIVEPPTTLPVGLLNFSAKKQSDGVLLNWDTFSETNNKLFKVYRAINERDYVLLGDVQAKGSGNYSFLDAVPVSGYNYYKLVQVDNDGTEVETQPIVVNFIISQLNNIVTYPNPVKDRLTLRVDGLSDDRFTVTLYDLTGKELSRYFMSNTELNRGFIIDVSGITSGLFFLKVVEVSSGNIIAVQKLVKD